MHRKLQFIFGRLLLFVLIVTVGGRHAAHADENSSSSTSWLDPDGIKGQLVLVGGGSIPEEALTRFLSAAGPEIRLVVITTADANAGAENFHQQVRDCWRSRTGGEVVVLHAGSREEADSEDFVRPLTTATAVWLEGGAQERLAQRYLGTCCEQQLYGVLVRGGVVGGTSAGAAIMSRTMIEGGNPDPRISTGFDLLPDAIVDQHFRQRQREARLSTALSSHSSRFGVGIDEATALVVRGREMHIVGEGQVTLQTAAIPGCAARRWTGKAGDRADLTAWRRASRQTADPPFPPAAPDPPRLAAGALVIVGGGALSEEILKRFIELAGGPDALIVLLPTATGALEPTDPYMVARFTAAGAKHVQVLSASRQEQIESPESLQMLREARGIWFGGGRQWRFVDAYENTAALPLFHAVLQRGGVIGGTSAGASIQAEYLVRGNPLGNTDMMAIGYDRGFSFLPGVAIDQHFAQRKRFEDLLSVVRTYPQLLGIGIDEATALVVRDGQGEVLGEGAVHFCSGPMSDGAEDAPQWTRISAGSRFDLVQRQIISP